MSVVSNSGIIASVKSVKTSGSSCASEEHRLDTISSTLRIYKPQQPRSRTGEEPSVEQFVQVLVVDIRLLIVARRHDSYPGRREYGRIEAPLHREASAKRPTRCSPIARTVSRVASTMLTIGTGARANFIEDDVRSVCRDQGDIRRGLGFRNGRGVRRSGRIH